jgi:hypothetical protein
MFLVLGTVGAAFSIAARPGLYSTMSQPGTLSCTNVSGTVTFTPPLSQNGSSSESDRIHLAFGRCVASGGGASPSAGRTSGVYNQLPSNNCTDLATGGAAITITIHWAPTHDGVSALTLLGPYTESTGANGKVGFTDEGSVTGSYSGLDNGMSSTANVLSNMKAEQIQKECSSKAGLKSLKIVAGTLNLQ